MGRTNRPACIAFDFETANEERKSACAIGVCRVESNSTTPLGYWLIRPPDLRFNSINTRIHGITEADVEDAPTFEELWREELRHLFEGALALAHYAPFDISVLRHTLDSYGLYYPSLEFMCTVVVSRKVWPNQYSYSLPVIAEHLGIEFDHHHALEDATATARIAQRACEDVGVASVRFLPRALGIATGALHQGGHRPCLGSLTQHSVRAKEIMTTGAVFSCEHPLFGKRVVFTGALDGLTRLDAMQRVVDCGGLVADCVSKKVDYLVVAKAKFDEFSKGVGTTKMRKVRALAEKGHGIEILPEAEFMQMLDV